MDEHERADVAADDERGWALIATGAAVIACCLAGVGAIVAHRFSAIFADLGIRIPVITEWALTPMAHAAAGFVLVAGAAAMVVLRSFVPFVVAAIVYGVVLAYALFAPLTSMITNLGSAP